MNEPTLLVTLGCSWVFGVGAAYQSGQSEQEYWAQHHDRDLADLYSWRGKMCARLGWHNLDLSEGGSSNQRQFRRARHLFGSRQWQDLRSRFQRVIVLWGITSTARNEVYSIELGEPYNFFYGRGREPAETFTDFWVRNHYDHDYEVYQLACEMRFWNSFFRAQDVENFWFDTINSHDYQQDTRSGWNSMNWPQREDFDEMKGPDWPSWKDWTLNIYESNSEVQQELKDFWPGRAPWAVVLDQSEHTPDRIIDIELPRRDLIAMLCRALGRQPKDQQYRRGLWKRETDDIGFLVDQGLLNPWSMHPTQTAHDMITDFFLINIQS